MEKAERSFFQGVVELRQNTRTAAIRATERNTCEQHEAQQVFLPLAADEIGNLQIASVTRPLYL